MVASASPLSELVAEMRAKALELVHDYAKNPMVDEGLLRTVQYEGHKIELLFSLDVMEGMKFWHLSLPDDLPDDLISKIVLAFLNEPSPIIEVPKLPPPMDHLKQFVQKLDE